MFEILFNFMKFYKYVPAPGDYCPEKAILDNTPKYTFGLKTNHEKPSDTPGTYHSYIIIFQSLQSY